MGTSIYMTFQRVSKRKKREDLLSELLEVEVNDVGDKWVEIDSHKPIGNSGNIFSEENRNNAWFGRLSGVRRRAENVEILATPGFPDGIKYIRGGSDIADYESEEICYGRHDWHHTHSHVYLSRLLEEKWTDEDKHYFPWFMDTEIPSMEKYCKENNLKTNEFRILISYD
jgi:hypothetical protein